MLNVAVPDAPALTGPIVATLSPIGPLSVPQGMRFGLNADIQNVGAEDVEADVLFTLSMAEGGAGWVGFRRWEGTIPAGGSTLVPMEVVPAQWFEQLGVFRVDALVDGEYVAAPLDFAVEDPTLVVPLFEDVTTEAGLTSELRSGACGELSAGAAWGDVEGDGDLDLYLPIRAAPAHLWMNDGTGHFLDEAAARGVDNGSADGISAVFADYDNDGDQDLYVSNNGPNRLYQNDGTGYFTDVALAAHVADKRHTASASWGDYDQDGFLDLYVTNNVDCSHHPLRYHSDGLYHNEGNGTFTDQTALLEETGDTDGAGFQAAWFDYDGDGDEDLYLANDWFGWGPDANHLWRNDGPGEGGPWSFTDVSDEAAVGYAMQSMGIAVGDYDRDLDLDFAVSDVGGNVLARNDGGTFAEVAGQARVARRLQTADLLAVTWGMAWYDLNLDGWEDLFVAAGAIHGDPEQPNQLFVNDGPAGTFSDFSAPSHVVDEHAARGVAYADYDRDGLIDLYVVNQWGSPILYHNVTPTSGEHWLEVGLTGTRSNRDGCGARLTAFVGGAALMRIRFCGSVSLASGNDPFVHFGLGSATSVRKLVIDWPSGRRQVLRHVAVDQVLAVVEQ